MKNKYIRYAIIAIAFLAVAFFGLNKANSNKVTDLANKVTNTASQTTKSGNSNSSSSSANSSATKISDLKNTANFGSHAAEHVFYGEINKRGKAVGFHHEGLPGGKGKILQVTGKEDAKGIYRAKVQVENVEKEAQSTFFPKKMTSQEVVDAIDEAFKNKKKVNDALYEGTGKGLTIQMYLDQNGKIATAFPIYNK
ncbi:MAG: EndoU domain-containing protein [Gemella sp.]|nr:EndoU domain-containing protein [Gemella sp.]